MISLSLVIHCNNMKDPKLQRSRFDQTIEAGSWQLTEHKEAIENENQTVSTTTVWVRDMKAKKNPKQMIKKIQNLIARAAEFADILEVDYDITIGDNPAVSFSHQAKGHSDYFKTKSYRY